MFYPSLPLIFGADAVLPVHLSANLLLTLQDALCINKQSKENNWGGLKLPHIVPFALGFIFHTPAAHQIHLFLVTYFLYIFIFRLFNVVALRYIFVYFRAYHMQQ